MLIEISTLPPAIAEQMIKAVEMNEPIHFTHNGKIIATLVKESQKNDTSDNFGCDMEGLEKKFD